MFFVDASGTVRLAWKALKKLISGGYVTRHTAAGEMTYQMTQAG